MKASELVLAGDGSLYHIHLDSERLADDVLLVGDPQRVNMFKNVFDSIEYESENRELHALTGRYHGHRLTALSTGMGCDNIDIVMTELDAALRMKNGVWQEKCDRKLRLVRIGTSGSLQSGIDCGSHVASRYAIGLDGLMNYYAEWQSDGGEAALEQAFLKHMGYADGKWSNLNGRLLAQPYGVKGSEALLQSVGAGMHHGITVTAPGFYGPQGRTIRLHPAIEHLNERLSEFSYNRTPVTNLEMETSAIFGFSHLMGHEALTVCLIIANRPKGTFLNDYHSEMHNLVGTVVERLAD